MASAAFGLLPVLNAITTDKHLVATIAHGDWVLASFDLTMLGFAMMFGAIAWKLQRRWAAAESVAGSARFAEEALA